MVNVEEPELKICRINEEHLLELFGRGLYIGEKR